MSLQDKVEAITARHIKTMTEEILHATRDAATEALKGLPSGTTKTPPKNGRRAPAAKVAKADALAERLLKEIQRKGDRRLEELAKSLRVDSKALKLPARKLVEGKLVKKAGQARGTRYSARA